MTYFWVFYLCLCIQCVNGQFNYDTSKYEMRYPSSYYLSENWNSYLIKPTKEGSLRELFDAGLRPGYTSMARNTDLDLKHARLNFILTDGKALPEFAAEQGRVTVARAGLSRLRFISQPLSIEEAKSTMIEWLPFFSEERKKSAAELDAFLSKVAADYSGYDDRDFGAAPEGFGGGWKDENGVGYGVRFEKSYNEVLPVRVHLNVVWHYIRSDHEERDFYDGPIPNPEGYEIPTLENWGPDDTSEMMYAKGISFLPGRGLSANDQTDVIDAPGNAKRSLGGAGRERQTEETNERYPETGEKMSPYWVIAGVLLLGFLAFFLRALKAKAASSG